MEKTETSTAQSQKSKEVFLAMVGYLGLKSEVQDKVSGKNIILSVTTDEPGRLIGRNGSALDSLGLLMNRILKKDDVNFPKVIVDVDGYDKKSKRERRDKRRSGRDRQEKSRKQEKVVANESVDFSDDDINRYVDEDTNNIKPVTTVPFGEAEAKNERRPNRRRNRRGNDRNDRRRGQNRENRGEKAEEKSAPVEKSEKPSAPAEKPAAAAKPPVEKSAKPSAPAAKPSAPAEKPAAAAKPPVEKSEKPSAPAEKPAPVVEKKSAPVEKPAAKPQMNRLQMECRNVAKEVKRWGDSKMLPPQSDADCKQVLDYFKNDKDLKAEIDTSRSYDDKKRVRVSLKN